MQTQEKLGEACDEGQGFVVGNHQEVQNNLWTMGV